MLEKKKVVDGLIKAASALRDPLASFPAFHHYNQQGIVTFTSFFSVEAPIYSSRMISYLGCKTLPTFW